MEPKQLLYTESFTIETSEKETLKKSIEIKALEKIVAPQHDTSFQDS